MQDYANIEILISDNASADGRYDSLATEVASDHPAVSVYRTSVDIGPVANWNELLKKASGRYALILSDDDYLTSPTRVSELVARAEAVNAVLVVQNAILCHDRRFTIPLLIDGALPGHEFVRLFWTRGVDVPTISALFDVAEARRVGGFDERYLYADLLLWLRLGLCGDVSFDRFPGVAYTYSDDNIVTSISSQRHRQNMLFIREGTLAAEAAGVFSSQHARSRWERRVITQYLVRNSLPETNSGLRLDLWSRSYLWYRRARRGASSLLNYRA